MTYLQVHMELLVTDWRTKPSQLPWTGNQPICQIVYISVFFLHTQEYYCSSWDLICLDIPKKTKQLWRSMSSIFFKSDLLISCAPPFGWGVESPTKFSKKGGLTGSQFLEGGCWKKGVSFFRRGEGSQFLHIN